MAVNTNLKDIKIILQNGYEMTALTSKTTVSEVLEENNIVLKEDKKTIPDLDSEISAGQNIQITDKSYNEGKTVQDLLTNDEVAKAAGIDTAKEGYMLSVTKNYTFKSDVMNQQKNTLLAQQLIEGTKEDLQVGKPAAINGKAITGIAIGKIGGQEYIVLIAAAPAQAK